MGRGVQVKRSVLVSVLAGGEQNCGCLFFSVCLKTPIKEDKGI